MSDTARIAMWSGPRTVSTALMRAWENRPDTAVTDEPLYAFYLDRTGLAHPGRSDVIASQPTDWRVVLAALTSGQVRELRYNFRYLQNFDQELSVPLAFKPEQLVVEVQSSRHDVAPLSQTFLWTVEASP